MRDQSAPKPACAFWLCLVVVAAISVLTSCSAEYDDTIELTSAQAVPATLDLPPAPTVASSQVVLDPPQLAIGMSWHWQLQDAIDTTYDVDLYDIDLFDSTPEDIAELRRAGRIVICYFSAGSFEGWRPDAIMFPEAVRGETLDGWEDETWLDIRNEVVRSTLAARMDLAREKGCDGVEPDNITAYRNDTGFSITAADQIDFNRFLADAAHERGLLIGLKNALEQIPELVAYFDFAVNEECHEYDECYVYQPFIDAGKPVFNAEYADRFVQNPATVCEPAAALGMTTLILSVELDNSIVIAC